MTGPRPKTIAETWERLQREAIHNEKDCVLVVKGYPIGIGYRACRADNKSWYVHHLADYIARGSPKVGTVLLHSCDNPNCINPNHIIRGTHADNVADKVSKRRHDYGVRHYRSRLTITQVREIRANNTDTYAEMSHRYGISKGGIHNIKSGRSWRISE
jgi:hypothetical protein